MESGIEYAADTVLRLELPGTPSLHKSNSHVMKRKWSNFEGTEHRECPPLALSLWHPPSSSDINRNSSTTNCTLSSAIAAKEEIEEEEGSSFDPGPQMLDLCLGNEGTVHGEKVVLDTSKASTAPQMFDLNLSISTGSDESALTSDIADSTTHESDFRPSVAMSLNMAVTGRGGVSLSSSSTPHFQSTLQSAKVKTCQFLACGKGSRAASGFCTPHGGGRRCKDGCHSGAEGRTVFCKSHGGGQRCEHLGCTKSAEGRTAYCIAHGGGSRCGRDGCSRAARGKSGLCIRHGGGKRCREENCTKSAEGHSGLCISHGGGRRCQYPECTKGAQGSTLYCKSHGGGRRCAFPGCSKAAEGSTALCKGHGGGRRCTHPGGCPKSVHGGTPFCVAHGGGKRCSAPECTKSARGRTEFCVRHGGGRRCGSEGCGKSAQGSTDYCKAHGGGRRCSWSIGGAPCDRFARGKAAALSDAHSGLVRDVQVHGTEVLVPPPMEEFTQASHWLQPGLVCLPEGRVHGGSLMMMLASQTCYVPGNESGSAPSGSGPGSCYAGRASFYWSR